MPSPQNDLNDVDSIVKIELDKMSRDREWRDEDRRASDFRFWMNWGVAGMGLLLAVVGGLSAWKDLSFGEDPTEALVQQVALVNAARQADSPVQRMQQLCELDGSGLITLTDPAQSLQDLLGSPPPCIGTGALKSVAPRFGDELAEIQAADQITNAGDRLQRLCELRGGLELAATLQLLDARIIDPNTCDGDKANPDYLAALGYTTTEQEVAACRATRIVQNSDRCNADDKSGFNSRPRASCTSDLEVPEGFRFFVTDLQNELTGKGILSSEAPQFLDRESEGSITDIARRVQILNRCTDKKGTGRTCRVSSILSVPAFQKTTSISGKQVDCVKVLATTR